MNDYDVKKALAKRSGQSNNAPAASQSINGIPNSVLADVFAGKRSATSDMMGHREELAPSIAAKMSQAFGMDFSAVKVYRSDAMAGTEMHGMAQGDRVVLSSDVDLNTMEGQATLGHELSHIRAQSMGMGSGRGLLNDASLEHQADSEGMLAARGMNISGETMGMSMGLGMAGVEHLSPIGAGLGASAAAPMQANKGNSTDTNQVTLESNAKKDGRSYMRKNRDAIQSSTGLRGFFDLLRSKSIARRGDDETSWMMGDAWLVAQGASPFPGAIGSGIKRGDYQPITLAPLYPGKKESLDAPKPTEDDIRNFYSKNGFTKSKIEAKMVKYSEEDEDKLEDIYFPDFGAQKLK